MKYRISGDGWQREFDATVDPLGTSWRIVDDDGNAHEVGIHALDGRTTWRIEYGGQAQTLNLLPGSKAGGRLRFSLGDRYHELDVQDAIDLLTRELGGRTTGSGRHELRSAMPGVISSVQVGIGDVVERDETVLILEAMKMENEVGAPASGRIVEIAVEPGATVSMDQLLAVVEVDVLSSPAE